MTIPQRKSGHVPGGQAGGMPASASNMLALPFRKTSSRFSRDPRLVCAGERDHSGRSGWHVASRLFLRADNFN